MLYASCQVLVSGSEPRTQAGRLATCKQRRFIQMVSERLCVRCMDMVLGVSFPAQNCRFDYGFKRALCYLTISI